MTTTRHSVDLFKCPEDGCTYAIGEAGPVDPDNPTEFEDDVREHQRSHDDDSRVHDVAEAERLAYAEDAWSACESLRDSIARQNAQRLQSGLSIIRTITERIDAQNEAAPEPNLTVGPCTCAGQADPECDCTGCIGRHIECRPTDPWSDTAEPEGEPADISEDETPEKPETSVVIDTATHALHKMLEWQSAHDALTEAITSGAEPSTREVIALHTLVADREAIKAIREYRNTIG